MSEPNGTSRGQRASDPADWERVDARRARFRGFSQSWGALALAALLLELSGLWLSAAIVGGLLFAGMALDARRRRTQPKRSAPLTWGEYHRWRSYIRWAAVGVSGFAVGVIASAVVGASVGHASGHAVLDATDLFGIVLLGVAAVVYARESLKAQR